MKKSNKNLLIIIFIILLVLFSIISKHGVDSCVKGGNTREYCERELLK